MSSKHHADNSMAEVLDADIFGSLDRDAPDRKRPKKGQNKKGDVDTVGDHKGTVATSQAEDSVPFGSTPFTNKFFNAANFSSIDFLNSPYYSKITSSVNLRSLALTSTVKKSAKKDNMSDFLFNLTSSPSKNRFKPETSSPKSDHKNHLANVSMTPYFNKSIHMSDFLIGTPQKDGLSDLNYINQSTILRSLNKSKPKTEKPKDESKPDKSREGSLTDITSGLFGDLNNEELEFYKNGFSPFLKSNRKRRFGQMNSPIRTPFSAKVRLNDREMNEKDIDDINSVLMNFKTPKSLKKRIENFNFKDLNENIEEELNLAFAKAATDQTKSHNGNQKDTVAPNDITDDEGETDNEEQPNKESQVARNANQGVPPQVIQSFAFQQKYQPEYPPQPPYGMPQPHFMPLAYPTMTPAMPPVMPPVAQNNGPFLTRYMVPGQPLPYPVPSNHYMPFAGDHTENSDEAYTEKQSSLFETPSKQQTANANSPSTILVSSAKKNSGYINGAYPVSPTPDGDYKQTVQKKLTAMSSQNPVPFSNAVPVMGTFGDKRKPTLKQLSFASNRSSNRNELQIIFADIKSLSGENNSNSSNTNASKKSKRKHLHKRSVSTSAFTSASNKENINAFGISQKHTAAGRVLAEVRPANANISNNPALVPLSKPPLLTTANRKKLSKTLSVPAFQGGQPK